MSYLIKNKSYTSFKWASALLCTGLVSMTGLNTPLHAEGLDRVYQVQANVVPSQIISNTTPFPTTLSLKLSPNRRKKTMSVGVEQGSDAYKINTYTLRVQLKPNANGSTDNGTLFYSVSADVEHSIGSHTASLIPHTRGNITLHDGEGQITLPHGKYFSGDLKINAIASKF